MRSFPLLAILATSPFTAFADEFKDDFDRPDGDWIEEGGAFPGEDIDYIVYRGRFRNSDGNLLADPNFPQEKEIVFEHLPTRMEEGEKVIVSVDFMMRERWENMAVGLALNYSGKPGDERHYNLVRFRGEGSNTYLQFIAGSSRENVSSHILAQNFFAEPGRWYTLTLDCSAYPDLAYSLREAGEDGMELASGQQNLEVSPFTDGTIALHAFGNIEIRFDNFSATVEE